ncbi:MAG: dihydroorotate dehydrogenase [Candidatus Omnitrophica bacterium]|nr:dihydroorotate dehydrogenase [Candidatus Omnitrophota bacterium]
MPSKLSVNIGRLRIENPVMVCSGTFGYAEEFRGLTDIKKLGAIVTKTITLRARAGNPMPRTCETPAGMLNSIGLENPGIDKFIKEKIPVLEKSGVPIIVSIASDQDIDEFPALAKKLNKINAVGAIELNISCPNVKHAHKVSGGGRLIAQDAQATSDIVRSVRKATRKPLITKLSPNVTDITEIAMAAEEAGSDAVALVNTLIGMSIDVVARRPKIAQGLAGLSGPAIRPVAVRMVWEVYQKIKIPIIGMGGIMDTESALEFFIAGSSAISVGTANFINPRAATEIISGIEKYLRSNKIDSIKELTGSLKCRS